jgi:hypothetical protein
MATALPRYFRYSKGVTFYTWTADQFSQYGTKVIPATVSDATYVLDEVLNNETELPILEHTTDTAGYTEVVLALFDLLGLQFSPRIRDLADQRLFRLDRQKRHPHLMTDHLGRGGREPEGSLWKSRFPPVSKLVRRASSFSLPPSVVPLYVIGALPGMPGEQLLSLPLASLYDNELPEGSVNVLPVIVSVDWE